jgi:hypothetical protein
MTQEPPLNPLEVCARLDDDGTWSVWVGGHRAVRGLDEVEAKRKAELTPDELVTDPFHRRMMSDRYRRAARERITGAADELP